MDYFYTPLITDNNSRTRLSTKKILNDRSSTIPVRDSRWHVMHVQRWSLSNDAFHYGSSNQDVPVRRPWTSLKIKASWLSRGWRGEGGRDIGRRNSGCYLRRRSRRCRRRRERKVGRVQLQPTSCTEITMDTMEVHKGNGGTKDVLRWPE